VSQDSELATVANALARHHELVVGENWHGRLMTIAMWEESKRLLARWHSLVDEQRREVPWTLEDLTSPEDVERNTHSMERSRRQRQRAGKRIP
jgi:hypothetical protein